MLNCRDGKLDAMVESQFVLDLSSAQVAIAATRENQLPDRNRHLQLR
jgi:hypothetical protein